MQIFQVNVEAQAGRASVAVNGETVDIPGGYGDGLNVVVISRAEPRSRQAYRFAIASADEFAQLIEDLPPGRVVAIAAMPGPGPGAPDLPERALRACAMLGSGLAANRAPGAAWAMIGQRGLAPGAAVERLSSSAASASADVPVVAPADGEVRIMAQGSADSAAVTIQDIVLTLPVQAAGPCLYAVTIDETTCQVLGKQVFTAAPRDMEQFAAFAVALPPGRLAAVAARGDLADLHLPGNAITAAVQLGSGVVKTGQAGYWAMVGVKGALPGSVAEAWSWKRPASCAYWRLPDRPNAVAGFPLVVRADFGSAPVITMGGIDVTTLPGGPARYESGLNVVVFDETNGTPLFAGTYHTGTSQPDSDAFADLVASLPAGRIVAIASLTDAAGQLTERARRACEMLGSAAIRRFRDTGSSAWALIGRKGCAPGSVPEASGAGAAVGISAWFSLDALRPTQPYRRISVSSQASRASISVTANPAAVRFPGNGSGNGLNVAVFDETTGDVLAARTFDTASQPQAADAFAALIEALPRGRVAAVAAMGNFYTYLNDRARKACESLGCGMSHTAFQAGNTWSFVGKKGAGPLEIAETGGPTGTSTATCWLLPERLYPSGGSGVTVRSAPTYATVTVGGTLLNLGLPGLNVAVLDERDGTVLTAKMFGQDYDAFAEQIEVLPAGRIVLVAVKQGVDLTDRATRACEMLGSGAVRDVRHGESWALAGVKAAAPGSALECRNPAGVAGLSVLFPAVARDDLRRAIPLIPVLVAFEVFMVWWLTLTLPHPSEVQFVRREQPPSRRYDQVTALVSHNAFANREDGWLIDRSQNLGITGQLAMGVRGLALDVYVYTPPKGRLPADLYLCHGGCSGNERTFTQVLSEVVRFLRQPEQRGQIVTIFIESPAGWRPDEESNRLFVQAFTESGATDLIFWPDSHDANPPPGALTWDVNPSDGVFRWPTIERMVAADKRLVLFVDTNNGTPETLRHVVPFVWRYAHESAFSDQDWFWRTDVYAERKQSIPRQPNRTLFLWNHFTALPAVNSYAYINSYDRLLARAKACAKGAGLVPQFAELDYVDFSDGIRLVNDLNEKVWTAPDPLTALTALSNPPAAPGNVEL